nr:hypothetical protein GCM10020093_027570 [Planobispora longispora]
MLTADDVPCSKPDPGFYRRACQIWSVDPADAVALEDSAHGVASAVGAGLLTLQVHGDVPVAGAVRVRDLDEVVSLLGTQPGTQLDIQPGTQSGTETLGMEANPIG